MCLASPRAWHAFCDARLHGNASGGASMNLEVWYPAMFVLGVVAMGICLLFLDACERI
jgi:hypothetical protein